MKYRGPLLLIFICLLLFALATLQSYRYSKLRQRISLLEEAQKQAFEYNKETLNSIARNRSERRNEVFEFADLLGLRISTAAETIVLEQLDE